jgi:hypothetical protein
VEELATTQVNEWATESIRARDVVKPAIFRNFAPERERKRNEFVCHSIKHLEKPPVVQPVKYFHTFYGT